MSEQWSKLESQGCSSGNCLLCGAVHLFHLSRCSFKVLIFRSTIRVINSLPRTYLFSSPFAGYLSTSPIHICSLTWRLEMWTIWNRIWKRHQVDVFEKREINFGTSLTPWWNYSIQNWNGANGIFPEWYMYISVHISNIAMWFVVSYKFTLHYTVKCHYCSFTYFPLQYGMWNRAVNILSVEIKADFGVLDVSGILVYPQFCRKM